MISHPASQPIGNIAHSIVSGSAWMIGLRWAMRFVGLISTMILARLLVPTDFGLIAMSMAVVGLAEVLSQMGQALALIRHGNPNRKHFDTAWTISVITGGLVCLVLVLAAPLGALYFHDDRLVPLIRFVSLRSLIGGFENIGIIAFRRDLQFGKEFRFQMIQRVVVFFATIVAAMVIRDFWALAIGIVAGRLGGVVVSYAAHPYRPRLSFAALDELWGLSFWYWLVGIAQFLYDRTDEMVVGRLIDSTTMGEYNVAADIATAPTIEVVIPMTRALIPIFAKLRGDDQALASAFLSVFSAVTIISSATSVGVASVADDMVRVILGAQWMGAVPLVRWLALAGGIYGMSHGVLTLMNATGSGRLMASVAGSRALVLVPILVVAGMAAGATGVAQARVAATLLFMPGMFWALRKELPLSPAALLSAAWRPVVAAAIMALAVRTCHVDSIDLAPLRLAADVAVGTVTYTAALIGLWALAGKPAGFEQRVLGKIWITR
jgi:O-antigen/teichoic acid export membrane protein